MGLLLGNLSVTLNIISCHVLGEHINLKSYMTALRDKEVGSGVTLKNKQVEERNETVLKTVKGYVTPQITTFNGNTTDPDSH